MKKLVFRLVFVAGLVACAVWLFVEPKKWDPVIAAVPNLAGLLATVERFEPRVRVAGVWAYRVTREGTEFSHAGRCSIDQDMEKVHIHGHRYRTCVLSGGFPKQVDVDWTWESLWAEVSDKVLRFDYGITIKEGGTAQPIAGICRVTKQSSSEMSGTYHMLPPLTAATLNAQWGTISFHKLADGAEVTRPNGYDAEGNEV